MLDIGQILILGVVAALGYAVYRGSKRDPREPPVVPSSIPFIGHLVGMLRHGVGYFGLQAQKHPTYPIFSLDMLYGKIHVVTTPALMQAVQRNNKTISFDPFLTTSAERIAGIHGKMLNTLREKASGGGGLGSKITHAMNPTLSGRSLDRMNERMVRLLRPFVDELGSASHAVDLYMWCRHAITVASTDATYGPLNPYKNRAIEDAFWDFETNLSPLLANILPWLTARKAWKGREKVGSAILEYYQLGGLADASELAAVRFNTVRDAGFGLEDAAQLEVPLAIALLSNTVPATFWVLFDLFSRPELLRKIRKEIELNALHVASDGTHVVDLCDLRDRCSLLVSAFQEILRTRTTSSPTRYVMKDVLLADRYLLRAGSVLNMPAHSIGRDAEVWDSTANEFDERRYMKPAASKDLPEDKTRDPRRTGGFMAFGVSPTICPGRHFASTEILGLAAMMVLRYDVAPVSGVWKEPPRNSMALVSVMGPVKGPFDVHVKSRKQFEGTSWDFRVTEGKGQFPLVIG